MQELNHTLNARAAYEKNGGRIFRGMQKIKGDKFL